MWSCCLQHTSQEYLPLLCKCLESSGKHFWLGENLDPFKSGFRDGMEMALSVLLDNLWPRLLCIHPCSCWSIMGSFWTGSEGPGWAAQCWACSPLFFRVNSRWWWLWGKDLALNSVECHKVQCFLFSYSTSTWGHRICSSIAIGWGIINILFIPNYTSLLLAN